MQTFDQLAASRRAWIEQVLIPWCRTATLGDLKKADAEWANIAGKVTSDATLWTWAWGRFPVLVLEDLPGINESWQVRLTLRDGRSFIGYPDAKRSTRGELTLLGWPANSADVEPQGDAQYLGPFSIDDVVAVERGES
ncbi:MAG: hypothetical protein ACKVT0_21615 [Planctomycetaceae bacterium]